jgi:hypothetical protein
MPFDIQAAQKAGYSMPEIHQYLQGLLTPAPNADVQQAFPAGQQTQTGPTRAQDSIALDKLGREGEGIRVHQAFRDVPDEYTSPAVTAQPDTMFKGISPPTFESVKANVANRPQHRDVFQAIYAPELKPQSDTLAKGVATIAKVIQPPPPKPGASPAPVQPPPESPKEASQAVKQATVAVLEKQTAAQPAKMTFKAAPILAQIDSLKQFPDILPSTIAQVEALKQGIQAMNGMPFPAVQQRIDAVVTPVASLRSKNKDQLAQALAQASVAQLVRQQIDTGIQTSGSPEVREQYKTLKDFDRTLASEAPIGLQNIFTRQPLEIPSHHMDLDSKPTAVIANMFAHAFAALQQQPLATQAPQMGPMAPQQAPAPFATQAAGPQAPMGTQDKAMADAKDRYEDYLKNNQLISQLKMTANQPMTLGNLKRNRRGT